MEKALSGAKLVVCRDICRHSFVNMTFVSYEQELPYCCRWQDAIDAIMEVAERGPELRCWYFDKPYTNIYLVRGWKHWLRALEPETRPRTAVRSSISMG